MAGDTALPPCARGGLRWLPSWERVVLPFLEPRRSWACLGPDGSKQQGSPWERELRGPCQQSKDMWEEGGRVLNAAGCSLGTVASLQTQPPPGAAGQGECSGEPTRGPAGQECSLRPHTPHCRPELDAGKGPTSHPCKVPGTLHSLLPPGGHSHS